MEQNTWAETIGKHPTRFIEWPLWLVQVCAGLFILTPIYKVPPNGTGGNASVLATVAGSSIALIVYAFIIIAIGSAGLLGLYFRKDNEAKSLRIRRWAAFAAFFLLSYFTILRILTQGPENLIWTSYFLNAMTVAVVYLRLKWEEENI